MPIYRPFRYLGLALLVSAAILAFVRISAQAQTPNPDQLALGAQLFAQNCAACHGPNGEGRVGATLAKNWPSVRPDLTVKTTIEKGVPGSVMPAWSQKNGGPLSDEEINALTAYILSWQTGSASNLPPMPTYTPYPPVSPVPNVQGDPNQGAILFGENCATCHGPNGEGRVGATLAKVWPSIRPDLTIEATIKNGVPGSVMPAWGQEKGGPLSDQNVNDLVAFILSRTPNQAAQVTETPAPLAPATLPWLRGWGGVAIFILLFALILVGAFIAQRRT